MKPRTKPITDEDGRVYADEGPSYYLIHILENGDEWRQLTSNASWHINDAAERRSLSDYKPEDGYVVRADTHEAVYYYKAKEGYQEGWVENNPKQVQRRKEAYEKGESVIKRD